MLNMLKTLLGGGIGSLEVRMSENSKPLNKSTCYSELVSGSDRLSTINNHLCKKSQISMSVGKISNQVRNDKMSFAFTLAEVLITLVIIGIIAAITVPAMIQQTQKQEYVSGLKKAHSTLKNALYTITSNNGYPQGDYSFLNNVHFIDEFAKVANIVKKCNTTAECFPSSLKDENTVYKRLNGRPSAISDGKTVITNDGQMYSAIKLGNSSNKYGITSEDEDNSLYRILVDLNGWKKPNKFGYDVFFFYVIDGKGVIPAGNADTSDCTKDGKGITCAAKVLKENKISY